MHNLHVKYTKIILYVYGTYDIISSQGLCTRAAPTAFMRAVNEFFVVLLSRFSPEDYPRANILFKQKSAVRVHRRLYLGAEN